MLEGDDLLLQLTIGDGFGAPGHGWTIGEPPGCIRQEGGEVGVTGRHPWSQLGSTARRWSPGKTSGRDLRWKVPEGHTISGSKPCVTW